MKQIKIIRKELRNRLKAMKEHNKVESVLAIPTVRKVKDIKEYDTDIEFDMDFDIPSLSEIDFPTNYLDLSKLEINGLLDDIVIDEISFDIPTLEYPDMPKPINENIDKQFEYTATMIIHDFYSNPMASENIANWAKSSMAKRSNYSLKSFCEYNELTYTTRKESVDILESWLDEIRSEYNLLK